MSRRCVINIRHQSVQITRLYRFMKLKPTKLIICHNFYLFATPHLMLNMDWAVMPRSFSDGRLLSGPIRLKQPYQSLFTGY